MIALAGQIEDLDGPDKRFPGRFDVRRATFVRPEGERIPAVVKRMPSGRFDRLRGPSRAERCLRVAGWLSRAGVPTPEPLGIEVRETESIYVCRLLQDATQVRAWFRSRYEPDLPAPPHGFSFEEVVQALGKTARKLHDAGVFFRDFTDGNVLVTDRGGEPQLWLIDLDRARLSAGSLGAFRRMRDLARPGLNSARDQSEFLRAYGAHPHLLWLGSVFLLRTRIRLWDWFKRAIRPWKW